MRTPIPSTEVEIIEVSALQNSKARGLAGVLAASSVPYARLLRCERTKCRKFEIVFLEVDVELGQKTHCDIRPVEPFAIVFDVADLLTPGVIALRDDFPTGLPHQNIRPKTDPASLCLSEEPYSELKLRWSTTGFIERIREWLRLTARGELHQQDQQLEPLLSASADTIILPHNLLGAHEKEQQSWIAVDLVNSSKESPVYRLTLANPKDSKPPRVIASIFETPAVVHGAIHTQPTNFSELQEFVATTGFDLCSELKKRVREWFVSDSSKNLNNAKLLLILIFPKKRGAGLSVEAREFWTFAVLSTIEEIAIALGVKEQQKGLTGFIIEQNGKPIDNSKIKDITIAPMRTVQTLSKSRAALYNGISQPYTKKILAVGMGALGSQIFDNLMRMGFGEWTITDKDILLPHNCARHALAGFAVGNNKADALAFEANVTIEGEPPVKAINADVIAPGDKEPLLKKEYSDAQVIFDFSASVPVARHLAQIGGSARRISVFLNPTGTDLVILAEDVARNVSLTDLEMEYYRLSASEKSLAGHLMDPGNKVRYARSCGDLSSKINQSHVALHAAVASGHLRLAVENMQASITVFRSNPDFSVNRFCFSPPAFKTKNCGKWVVKASPQMLKKLSEWRKERLPNETGGILIGNFDRENKVAYIVDALNSPKDSGEWPHLYIRGVLGLRAALDEIGKTTLSNLEYVGEWHSHPNGCQAELSETDKKALAALATTMNLDALPAVIIIAAERNKHGIFAGE